MPNNKVKTFKQMQGKGKDKMHPSSRKGLQMERVMLRQEKLKQANRRVYTAKENKMERPIWFIYSMTSEEPLTLDAFKTLIKDGYIGRNDASIQELESKRRPGRAKDAKLVAAEQAKIVETSEYESGFEVPDLTHTGTAKLIWRWLETDTGIKGSHLDSLRVVRVTPDCTKPTLVREGKLVQMGLAPAPPKAAATPAGKAEDPEREETPVPELMAVDA